MTRLLRALNAATLCLSAASLPAPADAGRYDRLDGEILFVVLNPGELVAREKGGWVAGLTDMLGVTGSQVAAAVAGSLGETLEEAGVDSAIEVVTLEMAATNWQRRGGGRGFQDVVLPPGSYSVISLSITDPEAVVLAQKGPLVLAAARALGVNLAGRVNAAVLDQALDTFEESEVDIIFLVGDADVGR